MCIIGGCAKTLHEAFESVKKAQETGKVVHGLNGFRGEAGVQFLHGLGFYGAFQVQVQFRLGPGAIVGRMFHEE